jgi:hypothetical protein
MDFCHRFHFPRNPVAINIPRTFRFINRPVAYGWWAVRVTNGSCLILTVVVVSRLNI